MNSKGFLIVTVCVLVAGVVSADESMGHSKPKSVAAVCGLTSADVTWSAVTEEGLSGYNVYRKAAGEVDYARANTVLVTMTEYAVQDLFSSTAYEFAVTAVYGAFETEPSQPSACITG